MLLQNNLGVMELRQISRILSGEFVEEPMHVPQYCLSKLKYAPTASCDVERSFSAYKLIITNKRQQMGQSNLDKMFVIYCNSNNKYNTLE